MAEDPTTGATAQRLMEQFIRIKRGHWRQSPVPELTSTEFEALVAIHHFCAHKTARPAGIRPKQLAEHFGVAAPTVNQYTRALLNKGYITQVPDPSDGRAVLLTLSQKGEQARLMARQRFVALFEGMVAELGPEKMEQLADLLVEVHSYLHRTIPRPDTAGCCPCGSAQASSATAATAASEPSTQNKDPA